ncbi:MAG: TIR domain-containing protein [Dokdonella sp.]
MRYRAFISYSHKDSRWATWLTRNLEGYRVPARLRGSSGEFGPLPERLIPFFRDREELASAGELGPKIQAALADSEALIVICSPHAARSQWVNGEILRFKRGGRNNRIYCLIVAGEPNADDARECFAPALRFELDADGNLGTQPAEPIAADIRPGKDGKSLARLKLLSGLLGVSLDSLRQREAARRHRRMLAVTALALLVMLVTSYLAVQAVIARHAAERRQKQAETLVDFMLGDLSDKLTQVSRLDILVAVDDQAMAYFQSLPTTDVTDQSLQQRAKALVRIGNVRRDQGHLPQSLQSFQAAAALEAKLAQASPNAIEPQLAYAEILTYIGTDYWYQGELEHAREGFEAAQNVLLRAKKLAPDNPQLLFQLATLDNNIGHVLEGSGHLPEAMAQYESMLDLSGELLKINSDNREWVAMSGLAHNNLAKMALLRGDLTAAVAEYRADVAIEADLAQRDPRDNNQAEKLLLSRAALGRTLALTGETKSGIAHLRQALDEVTRLLGIEPANTSFQEDAGLYSTQLARELRVNGDASGAAALSTRAIDTLEHLTTQDPGNTGWQRELAEARIERAQQARAAGQMDAARKQAQLALAILEPQLAQQPDDRSTVLASIGVRLLLAAIADDAQGATKLREQALQTAQTQSSGRSDPRLLALQVEVLLDLGRKPEALAVLPALRETGYLDPGLASLLRQNAIATPVRTAQESHQP